MNAVDTVASVVHDLAAWLGKTEDAIDTVSGRQVSALAATLDLDPAAVLAAGRLPELWHWMFFAPQVMRSSLGVDGHPARGGFLPPVALPNRMWAGGRLRFMRDLKIGQTIHRHSEIIRCVQKTGRNGDLVFVTVLHKISDPYGLALEEEHDILYKNPAPKDAAIAGGTITESAEFSKIVVPDSVLLFRYSALTFNGHRIHYDYLYVTQVEGYPGLVFHGPLTATMLLGLFREQYPDKPIQAFEFRALGPLFDNQDFALCGRLLEAGAASLWTDCGGRLTMQARVVFGK